MTTTGSVLLPGWVGCRAYDAGALRIGDVADVLFDARTQAPAWLALTLLGTEGPWVFAPARGLRHRVAGVQLAFTREQMHTAPAPLSPPGELSSAHAAALAAHYGVHCGAGPWTAATAPTVPRDRVPA
jgi:hypothetical protein